MLNALRPRLPKSNLVLAVCLGGLVLLPLVAAATFVAGARAERTRFEIYATMASLLQTIQDAEVDFSLARRSGQAFLRAGAPTDKAAVGELAAVARLKLQSLRVPAGEDAIAADVGALDPLLAGYAEQTIQIFDLVDRRRELAERDLRAKGDLIEAEVALYASRWQRVGLVELAGELARARVAVGNSGSAGTYGPDDLQRAMAQPLGLAATAEIPVPEAGRVVRRIHQQFDDFIATWRGLIEIDRKIAESFSGQVLAPGRDISARFSALTDRLLRRQAESLIEGKGEAARNDALMWSILAVLVLLSVAAASAAWTAFIAQRRRAISEAERRSALETALAQLDAAIRGMHKGGGDIVLRLPPVAPKPAVAQGPAAMPEPPSAKVPIDDAETRAPKPVVKPNLAKAGKPPARPTPPPPEPAKAAEPSNDALIAMLMQSLAESEPQSDKK